MALLTCLARNSFSVRSGGKIFYNHENMGEDDYILVGGSTDYKEGYSVQRKGLGNESTSKNGKGFCPAEREMPMAVSLQSQHCCSSVFYVFNDPIPSWVQSGWVKTPYLLFHLNWSIPMQVYNVNLPWVI